MTTYTIHKFLSVLSNSVITCTLLPEWLMTKCINLFSLEELLAYIGPAGEEGGSKPPPPWIF
jgi:hypothetical protein